MTTETICGQCHQNPVPIDRPFHIDDKTPVCNDCALEVIIVEIDNKKNQVDKIISDIKKHDPAWESADLESLVRQKFAELEGEKGPIVKEEFPLVKSNARDILIEVWMAGVARYLDLAHKAAKPHNDQPEVADFLMELKVKEDERVRLLRVNPRERREAALTLYRDTERLLEYARSLGSEIAMRVKVEERRSEIHARIADRWSKDFGNTDGQSATPTTSAKPKAPSEAKKEVPAGS